MAKQGFRILDSDMHIMSRRIFGSVTSTANTRHRLPAVSPAITFAISAWCIPTAENGPERRSDKTGQTRVTTLNATKNSIGITQSVDGRRKSSLKPWILKESTLPCSIRLGASEP